MLPEDHLKGEMHETIPATEFIGRMIQHLPPKNFRMVRGVSQSLGLDPSAVGPSVVCGPVEKQMALAI